MLPRSLFQFLAYRFVHRLGDTQLACADPSSFVCCDERGAVQALFWDATAAHPGEHSHELHQTELRLTGLEPGAYRLLAWKVSYPGEPLPSAPGDRRLRVKLTPVGSEARPPVHGEAPQIDERVEIGVTGTFTRPFGLHENEVWFVELRPTRT